MHRHTQLRRVSTTIATGAALICAAPAGAAEITEFPISAAGEEGPSGVAVAGAAVLLSMDSPGSPMETIDRLVFVDAASGRVVRRANVPQLQGALYVDAGGIRAPSRAFTGNDLLTFDGAGTLIASRPAGEGRYLGPLSTAAGVTWVMDDYKPENGPGLSDRVLALGAGEAAIPLPLSDVPTTNTRLLTGVAATPARGAWVVDYYVSREFGQGPRLLRIAPGGAVGGYGWPFPNYTAGQSMAAGTGDAVLMKLHPFAPEAAAAGVPAGVIPYVNSLGRVFPDGRADRIAIPLPPDHHISFLVAAPDGSVWGSAGGGAVRFDVASGRSELFVLPTGRGGDLREAGGAIAIGPDATAWVTQPKLGTVVRIRPSATAAATGSLAAATSAGATINAPVRCAAACAVSVTATTNRPRSGVSAAAVRRLKVGTVRTRLAGAGSLAVGVPVAVKVRRALRQRKRVRVELRIRTTIAGKSRVARRVVKLR